MAYSARHERMATAGVSTPIDVSPDLDSDLELSFAISGCPPPSGSNTVVSQQPCLVGVAQLRSSVERRNDVRTPTHASISPGLIV
jgi:hypothetical protein